MDNTTCKLAQPPAMQQAGGWMQEKVQRDWKSFGGTSQLRDTSCDFALGFLKEHYEHLRQATLYRDRDYGWEHSCITRRHRASPKASDIARATSPTPASLCTRRQSGDRRYVRADGSLLVLSSAAISGRIAASTSRMFSHKTKRLVIMLALI